MVHRLQAEASAAEQVAERAQQAQQAACAAVEQHRVAADLARQQAAHEQEQHQAQVCCQAWHPYQRVVAGGPHLLHP